jgi:hypothetical protein
VPGYDIGQAYHLLEEQQHDQPEQYKAANGTHLFQKRFRDHLHGDSDVPS